MIERPAAGVPATRYAGFGDVRWWRFSVERLRFVGGFGDMGWVPVDAYRSVPLDPLLDAATSIIEHMNDDHADANLEFARALGGVRDATSATLVGVDRLGLTLSAVTPAGRRQVRLAFPRLLTHADEAQGAIIELLNQARSASGA